MPAARTTSSIARLVPGCLCRRQSTIGTPQARKTCAAINWLLPGETTAHPEVRSASLRYLARLVQPAALLLAQPLERLQHLRCLDRWRGGQILWRVERPQSHFPANRRRLACSFSISLLGAPRKWTGPSICLG